MGAPGIHSYPSINYLQLCRIGLEEKQHDPKTISWIWKEGKKDGPYRTRRYALKAIKKKN